MAKVQTTVGRWALLAAVGAAWWIEKMVTVEWSYPYCGVRDDGTAAAVYGFPLPYWQPSIVTSLTDFFIPWLYVVNLAVIAGGILLLRPLASRLGASDPRSRKFIFVPAAALLLVTAVAFEVLTLSIGAWRPTSSSSLFSGYTHYSKLRPVAVRVLGRPRDCTASPYWFPDQDARSTGITPSGSARY